MGSNEIGMLTHSEIRRGVDLKPSELDDWQKKADGWTITLCSDLSAEHFGPGVWPEFHFWKGRGHNGEPPTVADLIYSIANDCSFLESEPDQVTYEVGKRIEHNENKMRKLFGHQLWEKIKHYDEDEMQTAFGEFS